MTHYLNVPEWYHARSNAPSWHHCKELFDRSFARLFFLFSDRLDTGSQIPIGSSSDSCHANCFTIYQTFCWNSYEQNAAKVMGDEGGAAVDANPWGGVYKMSLSALCSLSPPLSALSGSFFAKLSVTRPACCSSNGPKTPNLRLCDKLTMEFVSTPVNSGTQ